MPRGPELRQISGFNPLLKEARALNRSFMASIFDASHLRNILLDGADMGEALFKRVDMNGLNHAHARFSGSENGRATAGKC